MDVSRKPWPIATLCGTKGRIDPSADFQRPPVWSTSQKQLLIDTILRGLDIPKIYWQRVSRNPDQYAIIDGQQRVRAIWEFQEGRFAMASDADPVNGNVVADLRYSDLPDDIRMEFDVYPLDVVVLSDATDDDVRDLFLRLQNGTPLKAQEKRNAMVGGMRNFVKSLTSHPFFSAVIFKNTRYNHDLVAAQMMCIELAGHPVDIKNADLNRMYQTNELFDGTLPSAKKVRRTLDLLAIAFPTKTPELERFSVISLYCLVSSLIDGFVLGGREQALASWFIEFERKRREDGAQPAEAQDNELVQYHELTSHSTDSEASLSKRHEILARSFLLTVPDLAQRDNQRDFTHEQRLAIYRRDDGVCRLGLKCPGVRCQWDGWHADHKIPWVRGGQTTVANGQVACPECNMAKGAQLEEGIRAS
ncbi:MAG: DUF262 domain-containing protein [Thermoplasmata archaeon]|nr:DUF262 domain-containing protein [Thermoplasmata archaeon]